ncbi:MAG: TonB-dependent receptor [Gammaproteobacteria bacterium]|nr:TonB-dependent receptor [Gammaproteobacteria bacterium]
MRKTISNAVLAASVTVVGSLAAPVTTIAGESTAALDAGQLVELSFDELLNIEITSVSKKAERLQDAPAAVFVISNDDLRRSGVRSIPDALRMVPGVQVAQIDANKWAVTARGFNGRFANRLLVLMDGRSIYSPLYSGVYWESQDTFLDDIERIEVIRGPGATLWGANAANGVINIITKTAADTLGTSLVAGAGTHERAFGGLRHGFTIGPDSDARVYIQFSQVDEFAFASGDDAGDDWNRLHGGFRIDHAADTLNRVTVQGDLYRQNIDKNVARPILVPPYQSVTLDHASVSGGNLLGRWTRTLANDEEWQIQAYADYYQRNDLYVEQSTWTWDLDLQHRFSPAEGHDVVWGLGYRHVDMELDDPRTLQATELNHELSLFSAFVQDTISLVPERWTLTLGSKLEHNDFTGLELQPSARVSFAPTPDQTFWAAVSRAVRTPSVAEQVSILPLVTFPPALPVPGPLPVNVTVTQSDFDASENTLAYELGWRFAASESLSVDVAAYYNEYDNGRLIAPLGLVINPGPPMHAVQIMQFTNGLWGEAWGIELAVDWRPSDAAHFQLAYSHQRVFDHSERVPDVDVTEGSLPQHQLSLRASLELTSTIEANLWLRYVDRLFGLQANGDSAEYIPAYTEADLQLTWRPRADVELSLVGRNLLDSSHPEFVQELFTLRTEIERSVHGYLKVDF